MEKVHTLMAITDLYSETVDIESVAHLSDGLGGWTGVWSVEISDLPCHIWALSGTEVDEYAKKQVEANFGLMCAEQSAPAILEAMRVNWGGRILGITHIAETMWKDKYMRLALLEKPND